MPEMNSSPIFPLELIEQLGNAYKTRYMGGEEETKYYSAWEALQQAAKDAVTMNNSIGQLSIKYHDREISYGAYLYSFVSDAIAYVDLPENRDSTIEHLNWLWNLMVQHFRREALNNIPEKVAMAANKLIAAIQFYLQEPSDEQMTDIQELAGVLALVGERERNNNPEFARMVISANARRNERDALLEFDAQQSNDGLFVSQEDERRDISQSDQTPALPG